MSKTHYASLALIAVSLALTACESPFADSADRTAYSLIGIRQRQTLQTTSDTQITREMLPIPVAPETYLKVPPTENSFAAIVPASQPGATSAPGTQAAAASMPASTESAATSQPNPLDALLAGTPPMDLEHQGPLPDFPAALPQGKKRLIFDLDDCFNYALDHSRDYQTQKESLYIAALNVTLARHDFEPQFFGTTTVGVSGGGESSDYAAALNATQTIGVKQKLPLGGQIIASGLVSAVHELRDTVGNAVSASATLQANIPLLRGAGLVAQEGLIQTERSLIYEVRDFERFRRGFLVSVASAYFALVNQRAQVINRFRSVESYIFITQRTEALFKAGVGARKVTQLDLQRAQQSEYEARNDLTNAIQQYELSVDTFKLLLGMPAEQALDVSAQYLQMQPPPINESQAVDIAEHLRLDLQSTRDQVDDAVRKEKVASNNLLPDLNLTAQVGGNSLSNRQTLITKDLNYSAGLSLDLPLDRVAERNALRIAMINVSRAKRSVELAEDQVAIDVRDSLRRVKQQQYLVSLQRSNIELAQRRKEFADIQFRNGQIDNRDYLDAETALLDAQNNFAQAISALEIAELQFLRDTDQLRVDEHGRLLVPPK